MPSVADVMAYADYLKVSPVQVDQDRCTAVRNRNASCRKCAEACLSDAVTISNNEVFVDALACVDCGACASVCPPMALSMQDPTFQATLQRAARSGDEKRGLAVIACARAASKHVADGERICEVPCLAHASDVLLVSLASAGFDDIVLVDGDCSTCKYGKASCFIDGSVADASDLLEAAGASVIITRTSDVPQEVRAHAHARNIRGEDRRGILLKTGGYVRRVAGNVAQKTIEDKLGGASSPRSLKDRLGAGKSGRMPTFSPEGNFALLEGMERASADAASLATSEEIASTHRFGCVEVDVDACSGCGLCVLFCPTGALSHAKFDEPEDPTHKYLEFSASTCTQCGMCVDVCMRHCLTLHPHVRMRDLYDLEPTLIEISRPRERTSLFDLKKHAAS